MRAVGRWLWMVRVGYRFGRRLFGWGRWRSLCEAVATANFDWSHPELRDRP